MNAIFRNKKSRWGNRVLKIAPFISVVVASFSFLFGVLQYANSDRNRLNKDFYDEKYRVFKELSKSISTIRYKILFADGDPEQIRKELIPVFEQHLTYITYSKLVLDTDIEIEKEESKSFMTTITFQNYGVGLLSELLVNQEITLTFEMKLLFQW